MEHELNGWSVSGHSDSLGRDLILANSRGRRAGMAIVSNNSNEQNRYSTKDNEHLRIQN
jgi:hypothetical protein